MTPAEFEAVLDRATQFLTTNLRAGTLYHGPEPFEQGVLATLQNAASCSASPGQSSSAVASVRLPR